MAPRKSHRFWCASAATAWLLAVGCAQSQPLLGGGSAGSFSAVGGSSNGFGGSSAGGPAQGGTGGTGEASATGGSAGSGAGGSATGGSGAGGNATGGSTGSGAGGSATGGSAGSGAGGSGAKLVINEVDYDQPSTDTAEFIEIYNSGTAAATLDNIALVLINGANNQEYGRVPLSGTLAAGAYLVVADANVSVAAGAQRIAFANTHDNVQNGAPDGIALFNTQTDKLIDALSYEGSITQATINGAPGTYNLVEGTATSAVDDPSGSGSLARLPNGVDTNNATSDWAFTSTPTPGSANQ